MTTGQRAMTLAMIYPDPTKDKKAGHSVDITQYGIESGALSHARTVLRYSVDGDLANDVLAGARLNGPPGEGGNVFRKRFPKLVSDGLKC